MADDGDDAAGVRLIDRRVGAPRNCSKVSATELSSASDVFRWVDFASVIFGTPFPAFPKHAQKRGNVMLSTILIIVLILLLVGALPTWPYSGGWGYYPGGGLGLVLIIVIVLALSGRI
jgi:hypothetical protein